MNRKRIILTFLTLLAIALSSVTAWAFSTQWSTQFDVAGEPAPDGGVDLPDWDEYHIGSCDGDADGQAHSVGGSVLNMAVSGDDTACFGAYYRDNDGRPATFPADKDVRVVWRYMYTNLEWMGTQAGQLTGRYGGPQYAGMSGVRNSQKNMYHLESDGSWGNWDVDNPMWSSSATNTWHQSTFDFLCDGQYMQWFMDGSSIHVESNGPVLSPYDPARPYQFWMGNLLTEGGDGKKWTGFNMDYVYIYTVERPQMIAPTPGGQGAQAVSWDPVPNTTQPDGNAWGIQYQVRACTNSACSSVVKTSPWQSGTSYTFTGLPVNATYTYQARAKWVGTPELTTCWGGAQSAMMGGDPVIGLTKTATASAKPGGVIQYTLTVKNTGTGPATGVTVTDPIPTYILNPSGISSGGSVQGSNAVWSLSNISAGGSVTLSWSGTVDAAIPVGTSKINNSATACDNANHCGSATASTTINQPALIVNKTATALVWPGGNVSYQITVRNAGNTSLTGVTVTDPIPDYVANPTGISNGGVAQSGKIVWNLGTLATGASVTLSWSGTVDAEMPATVSQIANTATGTADGGLSDQGQAASAVGQPVLEIDKTAPAKSGPGWTITYQITVRNTGEAQATGVTVTDPIPNYVTNPTGISHAGVVQGNNIVWDVGTLSAGASATLSWSGTVDASIPSSKLTLENTATVCDGGERCAEDSAITELFKADARFDKEANAYSWPGDTIAYTLTVRNTSMVTLTNISVRDPAPAGIFYPRQISSGGTAIPSPFEGNIEIVWRPANLAPGQQTVLTWRGTADPEIPASQTAVRNVATLTTNEGVVRQAEGSTYILHQGVTLTKAAPMEAGPGETIPYTITVKNPTLAPLSEVVVRDYIPEYVISPTNIAGGGIISTAGEIVWNIGGLPVGASKTLTWRGTVDPAIPANETVILNRAEASDNTIDTVEATAATELKLQNVRLSKSAPYNVVAGAVITYQLTVENTGAATLYNLEVRDPVPGYVLTPTTVTAGGVLEGNTAMVWRLNSLAAGQTTTLQWRGTVDPAIPASQASILNTAELNTGGGLRRNAQARSYIGRPELGLSKRATVLAGPGETVVYTLTVQNNGTGPLNGVEVVDTIPEYITNARNAGTGEVRVDEVYWAVGALAAGASKTLTWQGTVDPDIPAGNNIIVNRAEASDNSGQTVRAEATTELKLQNIRLSKNASYNVVAGAVISYQLTVENTGAATLYNLEVRDPVPGYVLTPTNITAGGSLEGNTAVVWRLNSLAAGQTTTYQWRGTVDPAIPASQASILNIAELSTESGLERSAQARSYIGRPALGLSKRATVLAGPGETVAYTLTVQNNGSGPLSGVEVFDAIPEYITNARNAGTGEIQADEVYWAVGTLQPGASKVLTWQGTVDQAIPADETIILSQAEANDSSGQTAQAEATTELKLQSARLSKSAPYSVVAGAVITYQITVENTGAATLYDLEVRDPVPGYVLTPTTVTAGGIVEGNTAVVWRLSSLATGLTTTLQWRGTVDPAIPASQASVLNTAELNTGGGLERSAQARSYIGRPALGLSKQATVLAGPGETVVYTMTVQNNGAGPLNGVEVVDTIPEYIVSARNAGTGEVQADEIYWAVGTLAAGANKVLTWQGTVDQAIPADETTITGRAEANDHSGQTAQAEAVTELKLQNVRLSKSAPYNVTAGSVITYQITVENAGAATLYDLEVRDPLPGYVLTPTTVTAGGIMEGNTTAVWRLDSLATGQMVMYQWRGTVDPAIPASQASILNTAELNTGGGLERSAQARSYIGRPALGLSKRATVLAGPGETAVYTLTVQNNGSGPLNGVEVVDTIPEYITNARNAGTGEIQADEVYWAVGTLAAGASKVLTWQGTVDQAIPADETTITGQAEANDNSGQTVRAEATTELKLQSVRLSKSAPYNVTAGAVITYQLTVENTGAATLYDLEVRDPAPGYVLTPTTVTAGGMMEGNTALVWRLDSLAAGQMVMYQWRGMVDRAIPASQTSILNTAELNTGGGLERSAQARSYIGRPELGLSKRATVSAGPGETVAYTLTVQNNGAGPLSGVEVVDTIPEYITSARNAGTGEVRADEVYWAVGALAAGASKTLTWQGTVEQAIPADETTITGQAEASDNSGQTARATAATELKLQSIRLSKSAPYNVVAGAVITYQITVENTGAAMLYDLEVRDPVPGYVLTPTNITTGGVLEGNTAVVWRLNSLAAGLTTTLQWRGTVDPAIPASQASILNTAELSTGGGLERSAQARSYIGWPALGLSKRATVLAGPGETVAYTLTVQNNGAGPLNGVEVVDTIPEYITNAHSAGTGEVQAGEVYWAVGTLAAGANKVLTWQGTVDQAIPADETTITGQAEANDNSGQTVRAEAATELKLQNVRLSKSAPYNVTAGAVITYQLTVENTGAATLYDLEVRDPLPGYVLNPTTVTTGGILEGNTTAIWRLDSLAAGLTTTLQWRGTVDPAIPASQASILNTAELSTGGGLERNAQARSYIGRPELGLSKRATVLSGPGETVVYTLTVQNNGSGPLNGVNVFDAIPEYVINPRNFSITGGEARADGVHWAMGTLQSGGSKVLTWQGTVDPAIPAGEMVILNQAEASDSSGQTVQVEAVTNLKAQSVRLSQYAPYSVMAGMAITYRLIVENTGVTTLYNLEVRDPAPAYVLNPTALTDGGVFEGNTAMVWRLDNLPAGQTIVLEWRGTVDPAIPASQASILNTANLITGSGLSRSAQARSYIGLPELTLTKRASTPAGPGDPVAYTLTARNTGQGPLNGVEVYDFIPDYVTSARNAGRDGEVQAEEIYWAVGTLGPGESRILTWEGTVEPLIPAGETGILNEAEARDASGQTVQAEGFTELKGQDVRLSLSAPYNVMAGDDVTYRISVENTGAATLYHLEVRDPAPAYVLNPTTATTGGGVEGNMTIVWRLDSLVAGETATFEWSGEISPDIPEGQASILNTANLTTGGGLSRSAQARSYIGRPELVLTGWGTAEVGPGEPIAYALTVQNTGQGSLDEVEIFNPRPAYVVDARNIGQDGEARADGIYWSVGTLEPGESRILTWEGMVDQHVPADEAYLVNEAQAYDGSGRTAEVEIPAELKRQSARFGLSAPYSVAAGAGITYRLTVENAGAATLYDLEVRDPAPAYVLTPNPVTPGGVFEGNTAMVWRLDSLPAGQTAVFEWNGVIDPAIPASQKTILNSAGLNTGGGLRQNAQAQSYIGRPELAVTRWATTEAGPGDTVACAVTIENMGQGSLTAVEVFDPVPEYITSAREADNGGEVRADGVYWTVGTLGPGERRVLTWQGTVDPLIPEGVREIAGTAQVSSAELAGSARAVTRILAQRVYLYATATAQTQPGGTVDYGIVIRNRGEATLRQVEVRAPLPKGITGAANVSYGGELEGNTELVWWLDAIPAGAEAVLTWQGTVDPALAGGQGIVRNEVSLTTGSGLEREASAESAVIQPALRLHHEATLSAGPGEPVVYTLTVQNTGGSDLPAVTVSAPIPEYIVDVREADNGGQVRADEVYWAIGTLSAGESRVLTWRGTVDPLIPEGVGEIVATAQADGAGLEDESRVVTRVPAQRVYLYATATSLVWPGGTVDYGIIIRNRGEATLREVEVRNPFPNGTVGAAEISHGGALEGNTELVWFLDEIPAGEQVVLTWQGTVDPALSAGQKVIRNEVSLTTGGGLEREASAESAVLRPALRLQHEATLSAGPGEPVVYTLTVKNAGGSNLPEVTVSAPIPEYIIDAREASSGGQVRADEVYWSVGTLSAGESRVLTWRGTVDPLTPEGVGEIVATAQADGAGLEDESRAVTRVPAQRVYLYVTATAQVWPGGTVDYGIVIRNSGEATLRQVEVRDPLPNGIVSAAEISHNGRLEGNTELVWLLDAIPAGEEVTLTWQGTVNPAISGGQGIIRNEVSLRTGGGLKKEASAESVVENTSERLQLLLAHEATLSAGPGETVVYTLTVQNAGGSDLPEVTVSAPIPEYIVNAREADTGGQVRADEVYWAIVTLSAGESRVLTWQGTVDPLIPEGVGEIVATAQVSGARLEDESRAVTRVPAQRVYLYATATSPVWPGETVDYGIVIRNRGEAALREVEVRDPFPNGITGAAEISHGGELEGNTELVWVLDTIPAGEEVTLTWQGAVNPALAGGQGIIRNEVSLRTGGGLKKEASAESAVLRPALRLHHEATVSAGPGEPVVYTLTVQNAGGSNLPEVTVSAPIPEYITGARETSSGGQVQADEVYWAIGTLSAGESRVLTWRGTVDPLIPDGEEEIVATAQVSGAGLEDESRVVTRVPVQRVYLYVTATVQVWPGGIVDYGIVIRNSGEATLRQVEVRDPLPNGTTGAAEMSHNGRLEGNTELVWLLDAIPAGEEVTLTWQGTVNPAISGGQKVIRNEVSLTTGSGLKKEASAESVVENTSDRLQLLLAHEATLSAGPGEPVVYTLTVQNAGGSDLPAVTVSAPIPEYIASAREADNGGQVRADEVYWAIGTLSAGESRVLTWRGTVDPLIPDGEEEIAATAQVSGAGLEYESRVVTRVPAQRVYLYATATSLVWPGGTVDYGIVIRNRGEATLREVEVRDPLPNGTVGAAEISHGGALEGNTELVWFLDAIPAGQEVVLTWQGTVNPALAGGQKVIRNEVSLTTGGGLKKEASAESAILRPALRLHHEATVSAGPGEPVVYTLTVKNAGGSNLPEVTVSAPIPEYITGARETSSGGQVRADEVYWAIGTLSAGESRVLTWQGTVDPLIPEGEEEIVATAQAGEAGLEDESRVVTRVPVQRVYLYATATSPVWPGGTVDYGIVIRNSGEATLRRVEVRDPLPNGTVGAAEMSHNGRLEGNTELVWLLDAIPAGQEVTLTWQATVNPAISGGQKVIRNEVSLTTGGGLKKEAQAESVVENTSERLQLLLAHEATVSAGPGEPVVYTLTVQNAGGSDLPAVTVSAPIPEYIASAREADNGGQVRADEVYWAIGTLSAGESRVLTWRGTVDPLIPDGEEEIAATAQVSGAGLEDESRVVTRVPAQRVYLYATATAQVWPGETVDYRLVIRNRGEAALREVEVRNPLPNGIVGAAEISHGGELEGNTELVWFLDAIPAGEEVTLTWRGTVNPALAAGQKVVRNEVSLTTGGGLGREASAESAVLRAQLLLRNEATPQAGPGETVAYTLTVKNAGGSDLPAVTMSAPIPEYITGVREASSGGQVRADEVYWAVGTLSAGESRVLTWQGTVDPLIPEGEGEIVATAQANGAGLEDESRVVTRVPVQRVYLYATATSLVWPGGIVDYGIVIRNSGEATLRQVEVRDPLPNGITGAAEISHNGRLEGNTELVWFLDTIPAGEEVTLTWQGMIDPALASGQKVVRNEASLTTGSGLEKEASVESTVLRPALRLQHEATIQAGPGEMVGYTLTVKNAGGSNLPEVTVSAPIPEYITGAREADNGGQVRADEVYWLVGTLSAGESRVLTWRGTVDPLIPEGVGEIVATAQAGGAGLEDESRVVTRVPAQRVYLYATATAQVWPGGTVAYGLVIRNRGEATLRQVEVRDPLPNGIVGAAEISHNGRLEGNIELVWLLDTIPAGEEVTLTWQGTVNPALAGGQKVVRNEVSLTTGGGLEKEASAESAVLRSQLLLRNEATPHAGPGEAVVYTLTVRNLGEVMTVPGVEVHDPLPATLVNPTGINANGVIDFDEIIWKVGDLGPGERRILTWEGFIPLTVPVTITQITNEAVVSDLSGLKVKAGAQTTVLRPSFRLSQIGPEAVGAGEPITYTLQLTNTGGMILRQVVITGAIPAYVLSPTVTGGLSGAGVITWPVDALLPGESCTTSWSGMVDRDIPATVTRIAAHAQATARPGLTASAIADTRVYPPVLVVTKTGPAAVIPGQAVTYQIKLANQGLGTIYRLRTEDNLSPYLLPREISRSGYEVPGRIVWDTLGDLPPGQAVTLDWSGTVADDIPGSVFTLTNVTRATARGGVAVEARTDSGLLSPGLVLTKLSITATQAGGDLPYTITIRNNGPGLARGVVVRDQIPAYVNPLPASLSGVTRAGDALVWEIGRMDAGAALTMTWVGRVDMDIPASVAQIVNRAEASSFDQTASVVAEAVTTLHDPTLRLSFVCPAVSQAGETLPYQLRLTNAGVGAVRALQINLPMTETIQYIAGSGLPAPDGSAPPRWTVNALAPGVSVDLAFAMRIDPAVTTDTVTSEAQVTLSGRVASWAGCTTRLARPVLTLEETAPATALLNEAIPYTLTVKNAGEVTAYGAILTDTLPAVAIAVPGSVSDGGAPGTAAVVWPLGDLAPGQAVSRTFRAQVTASPAAAPAEGVPYDENGRLIIYNTATVSANRSEPVSAFATTLGTRPTLTLRKTGDAIAGLGQTVVYTLTAGNEGPGLARLVSLQDRLPNGLVLQSDPSLEGGYYSAADHAVTWALGDMPAGQVVTRTVTMIVPEMYYSPSDILVNRATLSSPDSSPAYGQATTGIYSEFELAATKQASTQSYPGGEIDYAITLRNTGSNLVGDVVVSDPLPAYTAYLDGSASLPPEYDPDAHALIWRLGSVAGGETREVRFRLVVGDDLPDWVDRVTNRAEITFSGGNVSASAITLLPGASLETSSASTPATPRPPSSSGPVGSGSPVAPVVALTASATPVATASPAASQALLPLTGGLIDPRTPGGKIVWAGALLLFLAWRWRARKTLKSEPSNKASEETKND